MKSKLFAWEGNEKIFSILPLFTIILFNSIYFFLDGKTIMQLGQEDGFFEYFTTVCLLVASIIMGFSYRKGYFFLIFLTILLFFGAGEEISWGQRLVGVETPEELKKVNVQGELNIHNLDIFNRENFDQSVKTGFQKLLTINTLYRLFIFAFGFGLPFLVSISGGIKGLAERFKIPVPPFWVGIHFLLAWLAFKAIAATFPLYDPNDNAPEEIFEALTAFVWVMIALVFLKRKKTARAE